MYACNNKLSHNKEEVIHILSLHALIPCCTYFWHCIPNMNILFHWFFYVLEKYVCSESHSEARYKTLAQMSTSVLLEFVFSCMKCGIALMQNDIQQKCGYCAYSYIGFQASKREIPLCVEVQKHNKIAKDKS